MKVSPFLAALCLGAAWAPGALAQGETPGAGWYLGGTPPSAPAAVEDNDIGYRHFGGYRFTRNWGVELGYSGLGRGNGEAERHAFSVHKFGYQTSAWTLSGTGVLPIGESLSLQGRLGLSVATPESTPAGTGAASGAPGQNGYGSAFPRYRPTLLWGVGGQYDLNNRFGLRLDYNNFGRLNDDPNGVRSDLWSINAVVRF